MRRTSPGKGPERIRWDRLCARLMHQRGPANLKVKTEHEQFLSPPRIDLVLTLQASRTTERRKPSVLRGLCRHLPRQTVGELKTVSGPFAPGDLFRLRCSTDLYYADHFQQFRHPSELGMMLLLPSITQALRIDLGLLGWKLKPLSPGYHHLTGCEYRGIVACLDEIADVEQDDLIRCIARHRIPEEESAQWLVTAGRLPQRLAMANVAGFRTVFRRMLKHKEFQDELVQDKSLRKRILDETPAKERLKGIPTKELLKVLSARGVARKPPTARRRSTRKPSTDARR